MCLPFFMGERTGSAHICLWRQTHVSALRNLLVKKGDSDYPRVASNAVFARVL
jgi:hypothetical protein